MIGLGSDKNHQQILNMTLTVLLHKKSISIMIKNRLQILNMALTVLLHKKSISIIIKKNPLQILNMALTGLLLIVGLSPAVADLCPEPVQFLITIFSMRRLSSPREGGRLFEPSTGLFNAGLFNALLVGWLVVVAWAVSRKTPIYFIDSFFCMKISGNTKIFGLVHHIECYTIFTFIVAHALTALRWYSNSLAIDS